MTTERLIVHVTKQVWEEDSRALWFEKRLLPFLFMTRSGSTIAGTSLWHDGGRDTKSIVGAKTLSLGVSNRMRLLGTLRATGSPGSWVAFRQVGRFFCRFASEPIRTDVTRTERR